MTKLPYKKAILIHTFRIQKRLINKQTNETYCNMQRKVKKHVWNRKLSEKEATGETVILIK